MGNISFINFGDIFRHKGEEYIFLKATEDKIYAAKILNNELSRKVSSFYEKQQVKGKKDLESHPLFAFVTLTTDQFKDRLAHFKETGGNDIRSVIEPLEISLLEEDIKQIKDFIKTSPCIPPELKDLDN